MDKSRFTKNKSCKKCGGDIHLWWEEKSGWICDNCRILYPLDSEGLTVIIDAMKETKIGNTKKTLYDIYKKIQRAKEK